MMIRKREREGRGTREKEEKRSFSKSEQYKVGFEIRYTFVYMRNQSEKKKNCVPKILDTGYNFTYYNISGR